MEMYRCFIAIDLPDKVKRVLAEAQLFLQAAGARIKWVEEVNFHLTMKFLGDVSPAQLEKVQEGLSAIAHRHRKSGFDVQGAGAFPASRNPKIIWAGIRDKEKALTALHRDIDDEMCRLGFPGEQKKFSPHLTLGRVKDSGNISGLIELLGRLDIKEVPVAVDELRLMRSRLTGKGPEYSVLSSFKLQEHF